VKWFYYSQVRTRYTSQLPQKLDRDLRVLVESEQPFDDLLQVIAEESQLEIMPYEFAGRAVQHPLFGMVRWYLKSRGAVCLTTGIGLHRNMGSKYQVELDHIFPYSQLKDAGYGWGNHVKYALAQEFTNRAILTQVANRTKSNSDAADYLASVRQKFPKALELQCVPEDEQLWKLENYEEFLEARRKMLCAHLNDFLSKITATEETATPATLEDMIAEGENDGLELKSSLRWDYDHSVVNKKLEDVVIKTVAAFANAEGGTLLIGVGKDGAVLGVENDYASLEADRDMFEIHLRNLLNERFGTAFVTNMLAISFAAVSGIEICRVDVKRSKEAVVVRVKDASGQMIERLYVRSGNSSQEIPLAQVESFLKNRRR
jgi:hypothetical protein